VTVAVRFRRWVELEREEERERGERIGKRCKKKVSI
jgi:hypothetical protein